MTRLLGWNPAVRALTGAATNIYSAVAAVCDHPVLSSHICGTALLHPCCGKKRPAFAERRYRRCRIGARPCGVK